MITDPPYSAEVHDNATSQSKGGGTRHRDLGFDHLGDEGPDAIAYWASRMKRWSVIYSDVESSHLLREAATRAGVEYVRTMPWVRWSMPQLSGDRPPQGFEHLIVLHYAERGRKIKPVKKKWNGPGNLTHLAHLCMRGDGKHKCQKPLDQCLDLVSYFSDPGETVFDPFAGSAAIGQACRLLGRNYLGIEADTEWATRGNYRLAEELSESDHDRLLRWINAPTEPTAQQTEGPSVERAAARARDRQNAMQFVRMK